MWKQTDDCTWTKKLDRVVTASITLCQHALYEDEGDKFIITFIIGRHVFEYDRLEESLKEAKAKVEKIYKCMRSNY